MSEHAVPGTALVTGGTGFIGSHLVDLLVSKGAAVTCLVRDPRRLRWLDSRRVRVVQGDCRDPASLKDAVRGATVVYHCAGLTKAFRTSDYYAVNRDGTRNLLDACAGHDGDLRKFVLVSSLAAGGPGRRTGDPPGPVSDYGASKLQAENEALQFADRFPVVILRPAAVYGPRDPDVFELFRWASRGFLIELGGGERYLSWCYAGDVAEAIRLAGERDVPSGSIYCIAEERFYSTAEFRETLLAAGGMRARTITVPPVIGRAIGLLSEIGGLVRGRATIMNRQKVREAMQEYWTCDPVPAREALGFLARVPLREGLERTWKWYREQGWLRERTRYDAKNDERTK